MRSKKATGIVLAVGIGTFMSALDSGVVNLAMPMIRGDFGVTLSEVEWIVTAYLLVVSSLLLTYGRIADLYGQKRVYQTGFVLFVIGSLLCGLSSGLGMLIAARCAQALGAGMLFATGPAIITNAVPPERRGKALSVTAVAVALGLSAGPVIGGTLTTLLGWQSIFYINLPVGAVGIWLVQRNIPRDPARRRERFDIAGSALVFVALLMILLPLGLSGDYDLPAGLLYGLIGGGLAVGAFFIWFESRRRSPMLDVRLFRSRVFTASSVAAMFIYMAEFMMVFLAPFYLQSLRGFSALTSGFIYLPLPLATMLIAPISGGISDKRDSRFLSAGGALVMACGLFMLSFLKIGTPLPYIEVSLVVTGVGFGLFQTPNNSAIMGNVPAGYRGTASGTLATMRNIGMALGVAVSGALFTFVQDEAQGTYAAQGIDGAALQSAAFADALQVTFLAAAGVALIAMAVSLVKGRVKTQRELELERQAEKTE
jgi:EmrB/QacA subfamily drug resistance transporter